MRIVSGVIDDGHGSLPVVWFNQPWVGERLRGAGPVSLYGPVRQSREGALQLVNPEVNDLVGSGDERIVPIYPSLGPLSGRRLRRLIEQCLPAAKDCEDPLPETLRIELGLPELAAALRRLHEPEVPGTESECARLVEVLNRRRSRDHERLAFDELMAFACGVAEQRSRRRSQTAPRCLVDESVESLSRRLVPFELTGEQRRVVDEIRSDIARPCPMARLIQGDVGSGKTVVAALAMLIVLDVGHQVAMMAPTELLAEQHARTLDGMFRTTRHHVDLLTSSVPAAEQRRIRSGLADGGVRLVVGTHSLVEGSVRFHDLGLAVIDEQHRFGVVHRQALVEKGAAPHLMVMTATPIPRSLALTVYGDLDLSVIGGLPPGRKPVTTVIRNESSKPRLFEFLLREIAQGGRAYLVYPLIESSEEVAAPALEDRVVEVQRALPGVGIAVLHGRLNRQERERVFHRFVTGDAQVLLATTVIEVGVDVPEASVMVVEGADRFGLSQLHQLRGRVGRGDRMAWCVLVSSPSVSEEARRRLEVLCRVTDGFEIAEEDLALRGPGALAGTRQWGPSDFRFADLARDQRLLRETREVTNRLAEGAQLAEVRRNLARYHRVEVEIPAG
jgi:ATP-dependent DNA helicase RecG